MRRVVVALAVVVAAGCSSDAHLADPVAVSIAETPTTDAPPPPACTAAQADADPTRSYEPVGALPPPGSMPAGSTMARIAARGRMIVGVSGDVAVRLQPDQRGDRRVRHRHAQGRGHGHLRSERSGQDRVPGDQLRPAPADVEAVWTAAGSTSSPTR